MAKPIEATPILDAEEWNVFLKQIDQIKPKPLQVHSVNRQKIREIMEKGKTKNEHIKK